MAPKLWQRLGEDVKAKNVRLFLEDVAPKVAQTPQVQLGNPSPAPAPTAPSAAAGSISPDPDSHLPKRILHNLPKQPYNKFIGRQAEIARLLKLLSPNHAASLICITGLGGVGKTSLAIACARRCLHASCAPDAPANIPVFDMIRPIQI